MKSEEKKELEKWANDLPENIKQVALRIAPWKKYKDIRESNSGNIYKPISYDEEKDGSITITCEKSNEEMPLFGGYVVFGINPDNLREYI